MNGNNEVFIDTDIREKALLPIQRIRGFAASSNFSGKYQQQG